MIPLNEYPKEELEFLQVALRHRLNSIRSGRCTASDRQEYFVLLKWLRHTKEAISDQEFKEKELPFKTE